MFNKSHTLVAHPGFEVMEVMECDGGTILFGKAPPPIFPIPLSDKSRPSEAYGFKIFCGENVSQVYNFIIFIRINYEK